MPRSDGPSTHASLLRTLRADSEEAWRKFLAVYQPLIYRWCRRGGLQHADAEEVSAAVLAKLARAMKRFEYDPDRRFRSWLRSVVANAMRDCWREKRRHPGAAGAGDTGVQDRLAQVEDDSAVVELVRALDERLEGEWRLAEQVSAAVRARVAPHTWQAYWLTAIEGQAAADVAARLGMTVAAVYVAKNRVGKMLLAAGSSLRPATPDGETAPP
jgi:RNA polymerase sigma-70 factor (ECF subfamily)